MYQFYFRQVLREHLGVKCLVGLTATSTLTTCNSIARQLGEYRFFIVNASFLLEI